MKKQFAIFLLGAIVLFLAGCKNGNSHVVEIIIPPGSMEEFVYSDTEISPQKDKITILAWAGMADGEVILKPVDAESARGYLPTYLTQGMPETIDAEKGDWFKVGVSVQNPGDRAITVSVKVENVDIRIP